MEGVIIAGQWYYKNKDVSNATYIVTGCETIEEAHERMKEFKDLKDIDVKQEDVKQYVYYFCLYCA